jgi:hypothetical protein
MGEEQKREENREERTGNQLSGNKAIRIEDWRLPKGYCRGGRIGLYFKVYSCTGCG